MSENAKSQLVVLAAMMLVAVFTGFAMVKGYQADKKLRMHDDCIAQGKEVRFRGGEYVCVASDPLDLP